ncbi:MAG: tRNA lysidine(34) synthetase TilS [Cloacibacterium sp.]|nr:tRNA lysidine(34) synthetase TilS [Cloacibacterium sp.]
MLNLIRFQEVMKSWRKANPQESSFLLATSGGVDSMVLAYLFQVSGFNFQVAHVNYHFRGEDSNNDQKLVEDFCAQYKIVLHIYDVSEEEKKKMKSLQNWARELRYRFFNNIREKENIDYLVTAHHLNDQLETFIINLSKASGIKGLSGIPDNENQIIRPLLEFSKDEIYEFAQKHAIQFREDTSNKKNEYLRNKIRNQIVPHLLETNENFLKNFGRSINFLSQTKDFVQAQIEEKLQQITSSKNETWVLNKEKLTEESKFVQFEILRKFGFEDEKEIFKIFIAQTGSCFYSHSYQLIVNRNELILIDKKKQESTTPKKTEIILPENKELQITDFFDDYVCSNTTWLFDADKLVFPLKIRKKKAGDVFFPKGMNGKKAVTKFFKDEKMSILAKQKIWLLCDYNDRILGIIPLRQDGRFLPSHTTKNILNIKI